MAYEVVQLEKLVNDSLSDKTLNLSFKQLDVSDITNLIPILQTIEIDTLDLSGNSIQNEGVKILFKSGLTYKRLNLRYCEITHLTDDNCQLKMEEIDLTGNILGIDSINFLSNMSITWLSVAGCQLNDEIISPISRSKTIISLVASHNRLNDEGATHIFSIPTIQYINLDGNSITCQTLKHLNRSNVIKHISLVSNKICRTGVTLLSAQKTLEYLSLADNNLDDDALSEFNHHHLLYLDLSYNKLSGKVAEILLSLNLTTLIASNNNLSDDGLKILAASKSIVNLDLSNNKISYQGVYDFYQNTTVKKLVLSSNKISDPGGILLAQNKSIEELYLSDCDLTDGSAIALGTNQVLRILNLNYNRIKSHGIDFLHNKKNIKTLIISTEQPPDFTDDNLNNIFQLSDSFLCIHDINGTFQFFNPSFTRLLGYTVDQLLGKSLFDIIHPDDANKQTEILSTVENLYRFTNRFKCSDNTYRTFQWTARIRHHRVYSVGHDITEFRNIEKASLDYQRQAEDNMRYSSFISQLSHEIRNPLTGIMGVAETMLMDINAFEGFIKEEDDLSHTQLKLKYRDLFNSVKSAVNDIIDCCIFQKAILDENLDINKIVENKFELAHEPFELSSVINDVLIFFGLKAKNKKVTLKFCNESEKQWVIGDSVRIKQIISNLVSNAIKFTDIGEVKIILKSPKMVNGRLKIEVNVIDNGRGIDSAFQKNLFQRFYQAPNTHHSGGSGLGLFLSRQFAQSMDGDITLISELGQGSIFTLTISLIPYDNSLLLQSSLADEANNDKGYKKTESRQSRSNHSLFQPSNAPPHHQLIRVLAAEDNDINRKVLFKILNKYSYSVTMAEDGQQAVDIFNSSLTTHPFDVILMDVMMPIKDGLTATRDIREIELAKALPRTTIIGLSANALQSEIDIAMAAGMDSYLKKPYVAKSIHEKISNLLSESRSREINKIGATI